MKAWWTSLGRGQRAVTVVVVAVVAVNVLLAALGDVVPRSPGGPRSSTYGTAPDGLAAYADLLERSGHDVTRLRGHVATADLPPGATAVLADPTQLSQAEAVALGTFLQEGGRLVLIGPTTGPLVAAYTGADVTADTDDPAEVVQVWAPTPLTGSAQEIGGDFGARWSGYGPMVPLAGADGRPVLLTTSVGEGRLLALADAAPLQNEHLATADNAALGLALVGSGRPVVFVESVHGFTGGGLSAVPSSWKWTAAGMVVVLLLGLWGAGTRFGPAEPDRRSLRPPRRDYVDAVAATMRRGVDEPADLAAPLLDRAHERADTPPGGDGPDGPDEPSRGADPHAIVTVDDALAVGIAAAARRRRELANVTTQPTSTPDRPHPPGAEP